MGESPNNFKTREEWIAIWAGEQNRYQERRALDSEVAEKVMGWRRVGTGDCAESRCRQMEYWIDARGFAYDVAFSPTLQWPDTQDMIQRLVARGLMERYTFHLQSIVMETFGFEGCAFLFQLSNASCRMRVEAALRAVAEQKEEGAQC